MLKSLFILLRLICVVLNTDFLSTNQRCARMQNYRRNCRYPQYLIREFKHDVYGRRQTAKITWDLLFFSCNP